MPKPNISSKNELGYSLNNMKDKKQARESTDPFSQKSPLMAAKISPKPSSKQEQYLE
jgi:hypothetical protein